jgi:hypothetical protein
MFHSDERKKKQPKEILGAAAWRLLHRLAVAVPRPAFHRRLLACVCALYPCPDCRDHFKGLPCVAGARSCPAAMDDPVSFWFDAHNAVSKEVHHPRRPPAPRAVLDQYATAPENTHDDDDALLCDFVATLRAVYVQAGGELEEAVGDGDGDGDSDGGDRRRRQERRQGRSPAAPRQPPREMAHSIAHFR